MPVSCTCLSWAKADFILLDALLLLSGVSSSLHISSCAVKRCSSPPFNESPIHSPFISLRAGWKPTPIIWPNVAYFASPFVFNSCNILPASFSVSLVEDIFNFFKISSIESWLVKVTPKFSSIIKSLRDLCSGIFLASRLLPKPVEDWRPSSSTTPNPRDLSPWSLSSTAKQCVACFINAPQSV